MDRTRFSDEKTGELVPIVAPSGPDCAFVPDPLPPRGWRVPDNLLDRLIEAWDCLGTLNGIGRTLSNPELLLRPLQEREAIQSSKLEGTYTTPEEVLLFAKNPSTPKSESDPANAWTEVHNYNRALRTGFQYLQNRGFTLNLIRDLHRTLLTGVRGREKTPGEFRKLQVGIGSDLRFIPPPHTRLPELLDALEKYMNEPVAKRDRLVQAFLIHYQFEAIHPFMDGNGRIGRVLLALMLYKLCEHEMPWLYLSPFFERYKDEYVVHLFNVSATAKWTEWIDFCLRGTIESARDAILRCRLLNTLKGSYQARVQESATARTHLIVESLFSEPVIRIIDIQKKLDVTYKTARADIDVLCRAGILRRIDDHYPASFFAWEIFKIAFRDQPTVADQEEIQKVMASAASSPSA